MPVCEEGLFELRLLLEELVCDICRFRHQGAPGGGAAVRIEQEVRIGADAFADVWVSPGTGESYVVEVKYGYPEDRILASITRKYSRRSGRLSDVSGLVLVVDGEVDQCRILALVREQVPDAWQVEIWDESRLNSLAREHLGVDLPAVAPARLQELRAAIDLAKGRHAFGQLYENDPLDSSLMWAFSHWRLKSLLEAAAQDKRAILSPGSYADVAVVFADISGYSGYVRDTPTERTIRDCLSAFCAKTRYQVLNDGGLLYQFLGDAVVGLFGIPDHEPHYVDHAFACARSLLTICDSISNEWQRQLDRLQPVHGAHVGVAMGEMQLISLRPFSRTHLGVIGDAINMAARLSSAAKPGQVMVSNSAYRELTAASHQLLVKAEPIEARNVGSIQAWRFDQGLAGAAEVRTKAQ